ncbi:MAG: hybrid sensor histidine kinase/response regulator [Synechococcales bacterium]|nr:hybrid sensor histidine kinase/response regulator [Synechococcales bacterium]
MSQSVFPTYRHAVPPHVFNRLRLLLQQTARQLKTEAIAPRTIIATETTLPLSTEAIAAVSHFTLVLSKPFSVLLVATAPADLPPDPADDDLQALAMDEGLGSHGPLPLSTPPLPEAINPAVHPIPPSESTLTYLIDLTFDPDLIRDFLKQLARPTPAQSSIRSVVTQLGTVPQPNRVNLQSQFTLELVAILADQVDQGAIAPSALHSDLSYSDPAPLNDSVALSAEAVNRAKDEFLAAVNHELRTPLTYILGMSATLLRWSSEHANSADASYEERQRYYLQNIHRQGEHLLDIINDILDLSQAEAGNLVLDLQDFSMSLLVQQCLKEYQAKAQSKDIRLELDLQISKDCDRFTADPYRLRQVIVNLLSNAIKFTPQFGKVCLRVFADDTLVVIRVQDTGIGIPEHFQTIIFEKFRQLDSSYRREYEGTGLGLALTKQLVEMHGGWIECDSTVNVGTVFTVTLPRAPFARRLSARAPRPESLPQPLGRIVLIDQHSENAHVISDMLTAAGYQLVWILEGLGAVTQVEMLKPVLVIIGARISDISGPDLIRDLRQNPLTKRVKVLAFSCSSASGEAVGEGLMAADVWLPNPVRPEVLLDTVGRLVIAASREASEMR